MKFKKAYVEITSRCNLHCDFCKSTELPAFAAELSDGEARASGKSFMSLPDFSVVLQRLKPHTDYVYLHVLGEPMLHPQLPEIIAACGSRGMYASITTNGTLLNSGLADALSLGPALRQINFSLHSLPPFAEQGLEMLRGILRFADMAAKEPNPKYIVLRLWIYNEDTTLMLAELERHFAISSGVLQSLTELKRPHPPGNGIKVAQNIFLQLDVPFVWPDSRDIDKPERRIFTQGKCYALRHQIAVLVDGTVVPCCMDWQGAMRLGNIFENSLSEIFLSDRAQNILNAFARREIAEDFCLTCGFGVRLNSLRSDN